MIVGWHDVSNPNLVIAGTIGVKEKIDVHDLEKIVRGDISIDNDAKARVDYSIPGYQFLIIPYKNPVEVDGEPVAVELTIGLQEKPIITISSPAYAGVAGIYNIRERISQSLNGQNVSYMEEYSVHDLISGAETADSNSGSQLSVTNLVVGEDLDNPKSRMYFEGRVFMLMSGLAGEPNMSSLESSYKDIVKNSPEVEYWKALEFLFRLNRSNDIFSVTLNDGLIYFLRNDPKYIVDAASEVHTFLDKFVRTSK